MESGRGRTTSVRSWCVRIVGHIKRFIRWLLKLLGLWEPPPSVAVDFSVEIEDGESDSELE